jgi:hypothetical protein
LIQLTLLYTAHIAGDLRLLAQLATLIRQERRTAQKPTLLIDLGDTCSLESWVCRVTRGRAPFLILDGMGYDAACIGGPEEVPIPLDALRRLMDTSGMPLLVWNSRLALREIVVAAGNVDLPSDQPVIYIDRSTDVLPTSGPVLTLGDVAQGHLVRVDAIWPGWEVQSVRDVAVLPTTSLDPTIAALVDLVEQDARTYAQQQGGT